MHVPQTAQVYIIMVVFSQRVQSIGLLGWTSEVPEMLTPHPHFVHGLRNNQTTVFVLIKGIGC